MRLKIAGIYILAIIIMFFCSCSQTVDTPARVVRSNVWTENSKNNVNISLRFKNDNAVLNILDEKNNKSVITGITLVTDDEISITDQATLTEYTFKYTLSGDSIKIKYNNKVLKLMKE